MSTNFTKFGVITGVDPVTQAYIDSAIISATSNLVIQQGDGVIGAVAQYTTTGRTVTPTPYTLPDTTGTDGQILVVSGGNLIYGSVPVIPPPPITFLNDLTVNNLSQGPSLIAPNYIFPIQEPASGIEQSIIFDNRYINITLGINDTFIIGATGPAITQTVIVPPAQYPLARLLDYLQQQFDLLYVPPNNVIFSYLNGTTFAVSCFGNLITIIVRDISSTLANFLQFQTGAGQTRTSDAPISVKQAPAVGRFNIASIPAVLQSPSNISSISCTDLGVGGALINALGNWNYGLGNLNNVGSISTTANTLNITTTTTQIQNGNSNFNIVVDGNNRLVITQTDYVSLKTLSDDTRFDLDTSSIYMACSGSPVFYVLGSSTRIWSPSTLNLITLDNSFVSLSHNGVEKVILDNTGLKLNNVYYMPDNVGTAQYVLTTDGVASASWQQIPPIGLYSQTGIATVANTNGEISITAIGVGSLSIPANYFQNGSSLSWNSGGSFRNSGGGQSFRWRLRSNGVSVFDSTSLALPSITTVSNWTVKMVIVFKSLNNLITSFEFTYSNGSDTRGFVRQQSILGFNPAIINTLALSVQWGTANINNTITSNFGVLSKIY